MTRAIEASARVLFSGALFVGASFAASHAAQAEDLRIGFIAPTTGIQTQAGADMINGFKLYLDEHNGMLGGAKVTFIVEDDQGKPDVGVIKAKKLILQDKVHFITGGLLASTGYALAPVSTAEKTVYVDSIAAADDLTQRELSKYPYFIRTSFSSSQATQPFGQWACEQGYKKVVAIAADYAFGQELVGGFQKVFEGCGGKIIQKMWAPLTTKDFGPYIASIKVDADAVFSGMVGPMSVQFPKQLRASGFKKPVIGGGVSYDEFALPFMSDEVVGDISALQYSAGLDTPANKKFVTAYRAKYGKVPGYLSESNYTTAQIVDEVMAQNKGKWPGPEQFIKQMLAIKINAVRGPLSFDDMRNPVQNIYVRKVEKKQMFGYPKPELWNVVIKTYPHVSQFWTFGEKAFLQQPVYSRDFPPCKYCE